MNPYKLILQLTDESVPQMMAIQQMDPTKRDYKGHVWPGKGYAEPGTSGGAVMLLSAYFCPDSVWYKNASVLEMAISAMEFFLSKCHEDGSFDLMETNFHDCTCNGFAMQNIGYIYRVLEKYAKTERELVMKSLALDFVKTSARAMLNGGFHTPNHRWVVTSALSLCYSILKDPALKEMAELYLSEDIDCNEEGDYTERSVGIYDVTNNESLTIIAQELGMPELYAYVERNLNKNWFYIEPDMTGLTLASRRQDYGKDAIMVRHFFSCWMAARRTGDPKLQWLAGQFLKQMDDQRLRYGAPGQIAATLHHQSLLARFLLDDSLKGDMPEGEPMRDVYDKSFPLAGVVRHRNGNWTCSLLKGNSTFMKVQNGTLKAYVKLVGSYFARGRMQAQEITAIEGGYRLTYRDVWGYVRPIKDLHQPDWHKIDKSAREDANMQLLVWQVDVLFEDSAVRLEISSEGTPEIPMKLEMIFTEGGMLRAQGLATPGRAGSYVLLAGDALYERYGEAIGVEGGFCEHDNAPAMRGSDPQPMEQFCVYMTGFTPVKRSVRITF